MAEPGTEAYIRLAFTLTFLVGVYQIALGLARMGTLVNFLSHTLVIGFTAGAAVLIAASQIKNFFGLDMARGLPFHEILRQFVGKVGEINPYVTFAALVTLATGLVAIVRETCWVKHGSGLNRFDRDQLDRPELR